MKNCIFEKIDGGWKCSRCGFECKTTNAPRKNCKATEVKNDIPEGEEVIKAVGGAGTELKKLLAKFNIEPTTGCKCNDRAKAMDSNGINWCENNVELIVDWMKQEAEKRSLPFFRIAARMLVKMAIRNAIRNQK